MARRTVLAVVSLVALAVPSGAAPDAGWEDLRSDAASRVRTAARILDGGPLARALETSAAAAGLPLAPAAVAPARTIDGLPAGLRAPVANLLGAVQAARSAVASAVRVTGQEARRVGRALLEAARRSSERTPDLTRFRAWVDRNVDASALASAGRDLAAAIDAAIPQLHLAAADLPSEGRAVGCDVISFSPSLCIGSTAANTYERDYELVIDLGGNDVHAHSAGGAFGNVIGSPSTIAVTIDLAGADRYHGLLPTPGGSPQAMGSASAGIGMLVDMAGDDLYEAAPRSGASGVSALASAVAGVGVFHDAAGDDIYRASARAPAADRTFADGFGYSLLGGTSLFLDRDGDDAYSLRATPQAAVVGDTLLVGSITSMGFGTSLLAGPSVFADAAGDDTMESISETARIAADEMRPISAHPDIYMFAAGQGFEGHGLALTGPGHAAWNVRGDIASPLANGIELNALGLGITSGLGAVFDAGGDDAYAATARATLHHDVRWTPDCDCDSADAFAQGTADLWLHGLGAGWGGTGLILESGGNDRYLAVAESTATARAEDPRNAGAGGGAIATAEAARAYINALGHGYSGGFGMVHDLGGDDAYETRTSAIAGAVAIAARPGAEAVAGAASHGGHSQALGAARVAAGELRDLGGADTYRSTNTASATTDPPSETFVVPPASHVAGFASLGTGWFVDVDGGSADTFALSPAYPACHGTTRGQDAWVDCGDGVGLGLNG